VGIAQVCGTRLKNDFSNNTPICFQAPTVAMQLAFNTSFVLQINTTGLV
jgi:hypothetical protein